jgi:hypothetical protein
MAKKQENEIVFTSASEEIELQHSGNSDILRIPAGWRRTIPQLKGPIFFEAHIEINRDGHIFLIFQKERPTAEVTKE